MVFPALFISHGAPTFALEPGRLGPLLGQLGRSLPRPRAVVVLSAHWITRGVEVQSGRALETIHDFGGFPRALYEMHYDAPGAPGVAAEVLAQLARHTIPARANDLRGRDHGAWVPLVHLYPEADVPVIQVSMPHIPTPQAQLELGQALAPLREQGILLIGSGSLTHNLYEMRGGPARPYVEAFSAWMWARIAEGDLGSLLDYRRLAPEAERAHPTDEHLLPLYFAIGAAGASWQHAERIAGGVDLGVISMDSYAFGVTDTQVGETQALAENA